MPPRFGFALLLWFMLLICAFSALFVDRTEAEETLASWYGPGLYGLPTASGEPYDASGYTAAHKTLPLGTKLVVSYRGRSVPVTINDRGPYVGNRELDLSEGAAQALGFTQTGVDYVDYSFAGDGGYGTSYPDYSQSSPTAQVPTNNDGTYIVQPGDTLSQIAARLGTSVDHLARYNGIADPDLLYSGQTLRFDAPEEDHARGGSLMVDDVAINGALEMGNDPSFGKTIAFDAAEDNVQVGENPFVVGPTSENGELGSQIPEGAIVSDEAMIPEGNMMENNVASGEDALIVGPASQNEEPEPQIPYEDLIGSEVDLAAAN